MSPQQTAAAVRAALPAGGLFAGQTWRVAPAPFALGEKLAQELDSLGRVLLQFYRAVNLLYRQSLVGKQPPWAAQWLDQGKPAELLELQRDPALKNELPRVIRPDILLTEDGFAITELDSVPGGIGLTAWLNQTYVKLGRVNPERDIIGAADGMLHGFAGIFGEAPRVHIVVSEESAGYRPEMDWLAAQLGGSRFTVHGPNFDSFSDGDAVYRFFELFDVANIPCAQSLFTAARTSRIRLTPPPRPMFEEKLLFALLWNRNLAGYWRQQLGEGFFQRLKQHIPYTWLMDPAPLPPHGAIPELNLTDWLQLKTLSQRERELILKVSGYSEQAWGARGVHLGSDLPQGEWAAAVDAALASFPRSPYVLQRFHKPRTVDAEWFDFERNAVTPMKGRVRLCPYYFVHGAADAAHTHLGGVLATIVPADKKIVHGMSEAVLAPCSV
jgi:hypothetical protein